MSAVSLAGRLLVATPAIADQPFRRSVVYLLDHDEDGALGVIINRPLSSPEVEEVLPDWSGAVNAPGCLFDGGPVATDSALAVGVAAQPEASILWQRMSGRVVLVDLSGPVPADGALQGLRVFAGYAGWGAEQLEREIAEGAWLVAEADEFDLFSPRPELLWSQVLRRQPGELRLWSTCPEDPTLN